MAVAIIWGSNFPIVKSAIEELDALAFNAVRITLAVVVLIGILFFQERKEIASIWHSREINWRSLFLLGLLGHFAYQVAFIVGLGLSSSGNAALLISTAPIWVVLVAALLKIEHASSKVWLGIALTVAGAMIIALGSSNITFQSAALRGDVLFLIAAICWGSFTALSKKQLKVLTPNLFTALTLLAALPFLIAIGARQIIAIDWTHVTPHTWYAIFHSGILSIALAYFLWNRSIQLIGVGHTAVYANLVPVAALVVGWLLRGEAVTLPQYLGGAIILIGLIIVRRNKQQNQKLPVDSL